MKTIPKRHSLTSAPLLDVEIIPVSVDSKCRLAVYLMRLHRPIGIYLLFWPGCWGLFAGAYPEFPKIMTVVLFSVGALFMRSFGCVINDIWDRQVDGFVVRTQERPLASNLLTLQEALFLAALLGVVPFFILMQFPWCAILVGLLVVPLIGIYPYMKRITYWAQVVLGITFSWGVLLGWVCAQGPIKLGALLCLYGATVLWVMAYDTIYGWQDAADDSLLGLKSTSLWGKNHPRRLIMTFYGGSLIFFIFFGFLQNRGVIFYGTLAGIGLYFFLQAYRLDIQRASACLQAFKSANWAQGVMALGLFCDAINYVSVNDLISYIIQRTTS